jgi:hypothetical protein
MKNMIKISRCIGEVRKKWYARNRKAWARYLLLIDRITLFALIAAARLVGVLKLTTLERRGILGRIEVSGGSESGETSGLRRDLVERLGGSLIDRARSLRGRPSDAQLRLSAFFEPVQSTTNMQLFHR